MAEVLNIVELVGLTHIKMTKFLNVGLVNVKCC